MQKGETKLVSTSSHVSRDLFVSQTLAKIKPESRGFHKIGLSAAAHYPLPQLFVTAASGVPPIGVVWEPLAGSEVSLDGNDDDLGW